MADSTSNTQRLLNVIGANASQESFRFAPQKISNVGTLYFLTPTANALKFGNGSASSAYNEHQR